MADIAMIASPPLPVWLMGALLPAAVVLAASTIPALRASLIAPSGIMRDN